MEPAQSCKASWIDPLFRKLFFLIPLGVIGNVVFVLIANDGSLFRSEVHFVPGYIIIAMLLSITPWFTGSLRLLLWSRFLGNRLRYREVFRIALGAELGAAISPPLIGGTAVKIGMLMRKGFSGGTALSLTALESMEDGLFFLIMVPLALTLSSSWDLPVIQGLLSGIRHTSFPMFLAGSGVACSAVLVLTQPRCRTVLMRFPPASRLASILGSVYHNFIQTWSTIISDGKIGLCSDLRVDRCPVDLPVLHNFPAAHGPRAPGTTCSLHGAAGPRVRAHVVHTDAGRGRRRGSGILSFLPALSRRRLDRRGDHGMALSDVLLSPAPRRGPFPHYERDEAGIIASQFRELINADKDGNATSC